MKTIKRVINIEPTKKKHVLLQQYNHAMKQLNDLVRRDENLTLEECSISYKGNYYSVDQFENKFIKGMK